MKTQSFSSRRNVNALTTLDLRLSYRTPERTHVVE